MQLDGYRPVRVVAIAAIVVRAKATVHRSDAPYTTIIYTLDRAHPEVYIGDYRVFNKHGYIDTLQGVGYELCGKGVCRGARTYPHTIQASLERKLEVFGCRNLGDDF
jgi:hypothetical protein